MEFINDGFQNYKVKMDLFTPPTYSHIYNLSTVQMSNDKGTWFGWEVSKK